MSIAFKIFDKTFPHSTGIHGVHRFKNTEQLQTVKNNHRAIAEAMNADNILILNHVFRTDIIDADIITDFSEEPEADAAVTTTPGILLTIQTADCVPVLLFSEDERVIGAAHCSWHTAQNNILANLVHAMKAKGATNIRGIIGPAIHQKSYEVDQAFYENIVASESMAHALFIPSKNAGRHMFNLPGFCLLKLRQLGVHHIDDHCEDTYEHPYKYHSYRRDTHEGISDREQNILSTIMIQS
jgi:YfiH family protein